MLEVSFDSLRPINGLCVRRRAIKFSRNIFTSLHLITITRKDFTAVIMEFGSSFVLAVERNPKVDVEEIDETDYAVGLQKITSSNLAATSGDACLLDILDR